MGERDEADPRQERHNDLHHRVRRPINIDNNLAETETPQRGLVHGDHAGAGVGVGGHGRDEGDVGPAVGGGEDEVGEFNVGDACRGG